MYKHSIQHQPDSADLMTVTRTLKALADPIRARIVLALTDRELNVSGLMRIIDAPQSSISRHLAILRAAGLVTTRREANHIFYDLPSDHVADLMLQAFSHAEHERMKLASHHRRRKGFSMKLPKVLILGLIFLQWALPVHAGTVDCDRLRSVQDVLSCALENHPEVRQAQIGLEQGKSLYGIASQRPNPELGSKTVFGSSPGNASYLYTELNLAHTMELGGKRGARLEKARSESTERGAKFLAAKEQVFIQTLLSLYRIRQLQTELGIINDALKSFARIGKQYRARSALNPEQQASLSIFEVAGGDYQLQKVRLETELDREKRALEFSLGIPFNPRPDILPKPKTSWPQLDAKSLLSPVYGSQVEFARARLDIAKSEQKLAKSDSWPDLKIGPSIEKQSQTNAGYNAYGFHASFPLPLFHQNGAGRTYAKQEVAKTLISHDATEKEARDQREYFFKRYQNSVKVLQSQIGTGGLVQRHNEIESLFDRGLLPGTLVIEIHRQMLDYSKSRNEQELAAVESLAYFYAFQGRLFEESL